MATKKKAAPAGKASKANLGGGSGDTQKNSDLDGGGPIKSKGKTKSKSTGKKK
jgi:hypothetical protein